MKRKIKFKVNPHIDLALTTVFFVSCAWLFYVYAREGLHALALFILMLCCFLGLIQFFKLVSVVSGRWISGQILSGVPFSDPLQKKDTMAKWADTCWQLAIHVSMSALDIYVISDEDWFTDTTTCWKPHPSQQVVKPALYMAYTCQLAIWVATALSHRFVEERRKDYVVMFVHHIITILLLVASHAGRLQRIGILVLVVHDVSDISVDVLKISNYLKLQNRQTLYFGEILYVINLMIWFYFRLYLFPTRIIYSALIESINIIGHFPEWEATNAMLGLLLLLHIWWFFLFLRIGIKVLLIGAHKAGAEEYEGDSGSDKDR